MVARLAVLALAGLGGLLCGEPPAGTLPSAEAEPPGAARVFVVAGESLRASDANVGTAEAPWKTIGRATGAGVLRPGDTVLIRGGTYRETIEPREGGRGPGARVSFAAWPGETVVITGADPADEGWTREGPAWRRAWTGPPLPSYNPGDPVFRRELVVAGGRVLRPVYHPDSLRPGTFYVAGPDTAQTYVLARFPGDAPPGRGPGLAGTIEIATRTYGFRPRGPREHVPCGDPSTPGFLRLRGLTFRHQANRAQWGAVCTGREGALFEHVIVEWTNGRGFETSGRGHTLRETVARYNGQTGYGGACEGCLLEDGAAVGNNWKGHSPFWEAGGGKWAGTRGTVFRRLLVQGNDGPGLWLDGDNRDNTVEGCRVEGNAVAGIMLELDTRGTLVQHNVITGTRWRAWSGAGVLSQAAGGNTLAHNTITGNEGGGLWLRLDPERRAPDGENTVVGNLIAGNATRPGVEARDVAVEGKSPRHVRTTHFAGNAYGARAQNGLWTSTFYVHPARGLEAGYRGGDLGRWRALTAETRARLAPPPVGGGAPPACLPVRSAPSPGGGAPAGPYLPAPCVGADPLRLRPPG